MPPRTAVHSEYSFAEKIHKYIPIVLAFGVVGEVGFEHVLNVSGIRRVYFTLNGSEKPESAMFLGDFRLMVVQFVEIKELMEYSSHDRWVVRVFDGFVGEDTKEKKAESDEEQQKWQYQESGYDDEQLHDLWWRLREEDWVLL